MKDREHHIAINKFKRHFLYMYHRLQNKLIPSPKFIGDNWIHSFVRLNKNAILEEPVTLYPNVAVREKATIGRFTYINSATTIFYGTSIGRFCQIGKNCEIGTVDHPIQWLSTHSFQYNIQGHFPRYKNFSSNFEQLEYDQIEGANIGNDVWIGSLSIVKSGVTIGDGAIVGAGSIVTKDVPPYAIVGGVPAKLIRYRFDEKTIKRLLAVKWWDRELKDLDGIDFSDIEKALKQLKS